MQVILNLTLNAIQAMPEGGEIVLSARQQGSKVVFQVRDQGLGIDAGDLDRIFDPFFTTKQNGTGLGLAVAHRIVSQLGGKIEVQTNNPDKGTTFSVILPEGTSDSTPLSGGPAGKSTCRSDVLPTRLGARCR